VELIKLHFHKVTQWGLLSLSLLLQPLQRLQHKEVVAEVSLGGIRIARTRISLRGIVRIRIAGKKAKKLK
jgi:hypothetical protein